MKRLNGLFLAVLVLFSAASLCAQVDVPEIPYETNSNILKWPEHIYMGEPAGVAINSKGHIFVYTRTGSVNVSTATSRTFVRGGSRLFEFDQNGNFVREFGHNLYGFVFAERVRVDAQDNVWAVDSGASVLVKFDPEGHILMVYGRKPEAVTVPAPRQGEEVGPMGPAPAGAAAAVPFGGRGFGAGILGDNFNRPSDVAWDSAGDLFVADGHGGITNARIAKFDKDGVFLKTWGSKGKEPGQFNTPHAIAVDAQGNVYVGDRSNKRIQVFSNDGTFKTQYYNVGSPFAMCITQGPHQYLYTSNSNYPGNFDDGEIYKMELDGTIIGKFGKAGRGPKDFGTVHTMDCRADNELYVGELLNWRVTKITLHPNREK